MTSKNTKRALCTSLLSLLLCVTMLVGTTFAWFTDNASTQVSNIVSGTLDIELLDGNTENAQSLEGKTLTFARAAEKPTDEELLFEPGAKYALQNVWLHNDGSLHAKYQVTITGVDGSFKLAEVINVYVNGQLAGTLAELVKNGGIVKENTIAPDAYDTFGTVELEMDTKAGNIYQGLTMSGIAITVQATQAAVEYDSDDNQYDVKAEYDSVVVIPNNGTPVSQTDVDAIWRQNGEDKSAVNFNGATVEYWDQAVIGAPEISNMNSKGLRGTIINEDTLFVDCTFTDEQDSYAFHADSGSGTKLTFRNCTFSGWVCMASTFTDVYFENCTFKDNQYGNFINSYQNMTFTDCTFESDFGIDDELAAEQTWTFTNCQGVPNNLNATGSQDTVTIVVQ